MMPFYDDMAKMARELLRPDTAGGLGQGTITVVRQTQAPRPVDWPSWEPWTGEIIQHSFLLRGAITGISSKYVDGVVVFATDQMLICANYMQDESGTVVPFDLSVGDTVQVDGKPLVVIQQIAIPGAGVKAAHKFVVRE